MSSIICLDAVEVLGVGLNTSSSSLSNQTERPQDKSAAPWPGACGWLAWIFYTLRRPACWRTAAILQGFQRIERHRIRSVHGALG